MHATSPAHLILSWQRVQVMKHFSPTSYHFIPLWSQYSPQQPLSNTFGLCSSLNLRDQLSHPYPTDNIIVVYILVFAFLYTRQASECCELNSSKYYINLTCH
jgi:hypothetical protein